MKKIVLFLSLIVLCAIGVFGCGTKESPEGTYQISYLDKEQKKIVRMSYEPMENKDDSQALVDELIQVLSSGSGDVDYVNPIRGEIQVEDTRLNEDGDLMLYFNAAYQQQDAVSEMLCRLALVQTLTQIKGVSRLEFFVDGQPLLDPKGNEVGMMTTDDFVVNPGEQINSIHRASLVLYFADASGGRLVQETQRVYYNSNVSLEKLVIEHLLAGPKTADAVASIPSETSLVNVSVADRVCYVSLDEGFRTQNYEIQEPVVIYSLVNSLTALPHIDKVQISVNGDTSGVYRENFALDTMYEEDLSYVRTAETSREVIVNDLGKKKGGE